MSLFGKVFKYIWPELKRHQGTIFAVLGIYSVRILIDFTIVPLFLKQLIDSFSGPNTVEVASKAYDLLAIIICIYIGIFFIARFVKYIHFHLLANLTKELRDFTFRNIEKHSYTFFSNTFAGSLVTKARRFVGGFESVFDIVVFNFLKIFIILTGVLIILFYQIPLVGFLFLGWILITLTTVFFLLRKKIKYDIAVAEQDSKISGRLADVFGNVLAVKFFSAKEKEIASFGEYTKEGKSRDLKAMRLGWYMDMFQHLLIAVVEILSLYVMIKLWLAGKITVGTIVLVETYLVQIAQNLWGLNEVLARFVKSVSDMKEMVDIFEKTPDILDPKNPKKLKMKEGHIVFDKVSFKYSVGENVLDDFTLDVKPGERIGLVGHSGAGKSTITKLLLRFNDVTKGEITIDGQDIRDVTQDDLRSVISYVPQEPILFHRYIIENINYAKPSATEEEVIEVSKKAHAHEFVSKLPYGYETLVGERGIKLSGGERQRVAIARAMLKDSPILVLDEATSSLDSISESYIQDAFDELMKGKTTIVVAHRLSTIQKMDRIIVLDKGRIAEEGTHKELLAKGGIYADLWNHQTGGFLEE